METKVQTLKDLVNIVDYSLTNTLLADPDATEDGVDYNPREVFSGHYVPVKPTPIENPFYIAHSTTFFQELGFDNALATSEDFMKIFSADLSGTPEGIQKTGWATGYALSIYGTEYYQQCPFGTGNGYGDGRAISLFEIIANGKHWEMQLKGGGRTPYCRGADGRAVLRSSIREFLAQEHMYALGVPTTRSLTLYTSQTDKVMRPWFREDSHSREPEVMIQENVAITTRVAASFLRVGQLELFGRRARKNEHPKAMEELKAIVLHIIEREYKEQIDADLPLQEKVILLAKAFQERLTSLVAEWIRVGYCQGNFNSDNCALGGFTLDYGPFGFMDDFNPHYQPWTGGGQHFSFLNQPKAAEKNYHMFYSALIPLLGSDTKALEELREIRERFGFVMQEKMLKVWKRKLGLQKFNAPLFNELVSLMMQTKVDYTIFFRELSNIPDTIAKLKQSFYGDSVLNEALLLKWAEWLKKWQQEISSQDKEKLSKEMKQVNPKYTLREWHLVDAYKAAQNRDYTLIKELQEVMNNPYDEQSDGIEKKYYRKKPMELFSIAGVSHISCSS